MVVKKTVKKAVKKTVKKVVKKAVKKAVKTVGKKVLEKATTANIVEVKVLKILDNNIPEECHFYVKDGRRLKNVLDLVNVFDDMAEEVYQHHVTEENNDFANWVHHVLDEEKLAQDLKGAEDKMDMPLTLLKHAGKELTK